MGKLITREEQQLENTWDLTTIFKSDADFNDAYKELESKIDDNGKFKDGFDSADKLADALELERSLDTELGKLFVYAHLKHDQDTSNDTYSALESRARSLAVKYSSAWSFLVPAIMDIPEDKLKEFAEDERLAEFKFDLEKLNKQRPHVLSDKEEQLLAQAGEIMHTPTQVYGMFNNADVDFKPAVDSEGKEHVLTQGNYVELLKSPDRNLRESAYYNLYGEIGR